MRDKRTALSENSTVPDELEKKENEDHDGCGHYVASNDDRRQCILRIK
jgi:hypothetical protein